MLADRKEINGLREVKGLSNIPTRKTARLLLRPWKESDLSPFATMCADTRVMEFFPKTLDRVESDGVANRIRQHFDQHGFGLWAVEIPYVAPFIGFVGLNIPQFEAHFTPCVEIAWRLAAEFWGHGYATEGARAAMAFGFDELMLSEIVSFTAVINHRSQQVMRRLRMIHSPNDDFDHPKVDIGDRLQRHVLYRLSRDGWKSSGKG